MLFENPTINIVAEESNATRTGLHGLFLDVQMLYTRCFLPDTVTEGAFAPALRAACLLFGVGCSGTLQDSEYELQCSTGRGQASRSYST